LIVNFLIDLTMPITEVFSQTISSLVELAYNNDSWVKKLVTNYNCILYG